MRMRNQTLQRIHRLRRSCTLGRAVDVKLAIEALDVAATHLVDIVWIVLCRQYKNSTVIRVVLYQCGVVHQQAIIALNECTWSAIVDTNMPLHGVRGSLLDCYPWLTECFKTYAPRIEHALSLRIVRPVIRQLSMAKMTASA